MSVQFRDLRIGDEFWFVSNRDEIYKKTKISRFGYENSSGQKFDIRKTKPTITTITNGAKTFVERVSDEK